MHVVVAVNESHVGSGTRGSVFTLEVSRQKAGKISFRSGRDPSKRVCVYRLGDGALSGGRVAIYLPVVYPYRRYSCRTDMQEHTAYRGDTELMQKSSWFRFCVCLCNLLEILNASVRLGSMIVGSDPMSVYKK